MTNVAAPMRDAYLARKNGGVYDTGAIAYCDWYEGFIDWLERRNAA
jgi:hypothetical protein